MISALSAVGHEVAGARAAPDALGLLRPMGVAAVCFLATGCQRETPATAAQQKSAAVPDAARPVEHQMGRAIAPHRLEFDRQRA
jgi:hypothetical protein